MRKLPDRVRIFPATLSGSVAVAGDKSIGHRCLIIGSLASTEVTVSGLAPSGDIAATAESLRRLGARVELATGADGLLEGVVEGPILRDPTAGPIELDCGNSGTTFRLVAGLAAGAGRAVILDGDASLRRRPMKRVIEPLEAMGIRSRARDEQFPPLELQAGTIRGVEWRSSVASAQVKSAILLAAVAGGVSAEVVSPAPSRDHTERMLAHGGVPVRSTIEANGEERVRVEPAQPTFTALAAPRDPSAAAFWHVAAACGEGRLRTPDLCLNPGRTGALEVLTTMEADVRIANRREAHGEPIGDVEVRPGGRKGTEISGALVVRCLDELPVLALAGGLSEDGLLVRDAAELRVKESDRIRVLAQTLRELGMVIDEHPDGFFVPGGQQPHAGSVDAHGDHRIAMTAAIAACHGSGPVDISGFSAVGTSYPGFLDDLVQLGGRVEVLGD